MPDIIINLVDIMSEEEGQKEGTEVTGMFGNIAVNDIELGPYQYGIFDDDDDYINVSDVCNKFHQKKF